MMLPDSLPQYTARELERRATDFLASQYRGEAEVPVDVEFLLETLPGVDLDVWRGLRENHQLDGIVLRDVQSGNIVIKIDEMLADQQANRYRMTVAEELAHIVLHRFSTRFARSMTFENFSGTPNTRASSGMRSVLRRRSSCLEASC
jgi:hypothetical protein